MDETTEETVVEAPAHVIPPTTEAAQEKAAHGAKVWTWIARFTGLALLAAVLGFGFTFSDQEVVDVPGPCVP